MIRRSTFHGPHRGTPAQNVRSEIIEPIGGLNVAHHPSKLRPGETPYSENFVVHDGFLTPRSGISQAGTTGVTGTPLGSVVADMYIPSPLFREQFYVLSTSTIRTITDNVTPGWSPVPQSGTWSSATVSNNGFPNYFSTTPFFLTFAAATPEVFNSWFATNWAMPPKAFGADSGSATSARDLTEFYSIDSYARYVSAFDDRLLFFHSGTTNSGQATVHPTRVSWSARGVPSDFTNGGYEDLNDMAGAGTGIIAEEDRLLLFSEKEVWAGRPRRDAFAFDFDAIDEIHGCPMEFSRTIQHTNAGTIWLGRNFELCRVINTEVRTLGKKIAHFLEDEMREWAHCWALYNERTHTYALFYSDSTGAYPSKAFFLNTETIVPVDQETDDGAWMWQNFEGGFDFVTGGIFYGNMLLVSSTGTAYRMLDRYAFDGGASKFCTWRSHAMRAERDLFPYEIIQDVWIETTYDGEDDAASYLSVYVSADNGATFTFGGASSVTSGMNYTHIPISDGPAGRNSMFELRTNSATFPRISEMQVKLRGYTGRHEG